MPFSCDLGTLPPSRYTFTQATIFKDPRKVDQTTDGLSDCLDAPLSLLEICRGNHEKTLVSLRQTINLLEGGTP